MHHFRAAFIKLMVWQPEKQTASSITNLAMAIYTINENNYEMQKLWGADTFVDFDHGLNTVVNKIREALGDSTVVRGATEP